MNLGNWAGGKSKQKKRQNASIVNSISLSNAEVIQRDITGYF